MHTCDGLVVTCIDFRLQDLKSAAEKIKSEIPGVNIETYYLHLDGTFEKIS